MNRYPVWVYVTVAVAIVLGLLYTLPNFFGESPAVQVSSSRATLKIDTATLSRVEEVLQKANVPYTGIFLDLRRRAVRQPAAVVEHGDLVAHAHNHVHMMLDQDHGGAVGADACDQLAHMRRLGDVEPGGGLVEQQQGRARHDGARDLE